MIGRFHCSADVRVVVLTLVSHHHCDIVHNAWHELIRTDGPHHHHLLEHVQLVVGAWEYLQPGTCTVADSLPFMVILHEVLADALELLYFVESHQLLVALVPDVIWHPLAWLHRNARLALELAVHHIVPALWLNLAVVSHDVADHQEGEHPPILLQQFAADILVEALSK